MNKPKICAIAIIGKNRELGKDGHLLFHIKDDIKRFRAITRGHPVIMGRKTHESIGRLLPDRTNIVVTRDDSYRSKDVVVVNSLEEALRWVRQAHHRQAEGDNEEVFIIGGGQIYEQALPYVDKLYLTIVNETVDADTFFPDYSEFRKIVCREKKEENGLKFEYLDLER